MQARPDQQASRRRTAPRLGPVIVAGLLVLASCSSDGSDSTTKKPKARTTSTTDATPAATTASAAPALTSDGTVLAEVDGIGSVRSHEEADATLTVAATTAEAPALPDGALAIADGLGVEVEGTPTGPLEVRLQLPDPPTPEAIPVVVHVRDDGTTVLEAGLYDDATNEIVVGARTFSDRFGAWWDPRNWIEEIIQVGQGGFDFVSDYISGRTDPPACSPAAPGWATAAKTDLSTVHVCLKSNPAKDGTARAEIYLKSNRAAAQFISVPAGAEYQWVQSQPPWAQKLLTSIGGGTAGDTLLLGGQAMSVGYRQPFQDVKLEARTYQTQFVGFLNQIVGLFGILEVDDTYAVAALVGECTKDIVALDDTGFGLVPDGFDDLDDAVATVISCVIELASNPDTAVAAFDSALREAGTSAVDRNSALAVLRKPLDRMEPLAKRIAQVLQVAGAAIRAWDGIWDNVNEGLLTVSLAGAEETGAEGTAQAFLDAVAAGDQSAAAGLSKPTEPTTYDWARSQYETSSEVWGDATCMSEGTRRSACRWLEADPSSQLVLVQDNGRWVVSHPRSPDGALELSNGPEFHPFCVEDTSPLNVRGGPGRSWPAFATLAVDDCDVLGYSVVVEDERGSWWRVVGLPDGDLGWVSDNRVEISISE